MPTVLHAQSVRLQSRDYDFNGRQGTSHKATLSDGDDLLTVKIPEDVYEATSLDVLDALRTVGTDVEIALYTPRMFTDQNGKASFSLRARAIRIATPAKG